MKVAISEKEIGAWHLWGNFYLLKNRLSGCADLACVFGVVCIARNGSWWSSNSWISYMKKLQLRKIEIKLWMRGRMLTTEICGVGWRFTFQLRSFWQWERGRKHSQASLPVTWPYPRDLVWEEGGVTIHLLIGVHSPPGLIPFSFVFRGRNR